MQVFTKLIPALVLAGALSRAQAQQAVTMEGGRPPRKDRPAESRRPAGGVFMKEGKMLTFSDDILTPMAETTTMSDGTKVMTDGSVVTPEGKQLMLHNGQAVLPDGRIVDRSLLKGNSKLKRNM